MTQNKVIPLQSVPMTPSEIHKGIGLNNASIMNKTWISNENLQFILSKDHNGTLFIRTITHCSEPISICSSICSSIQLSSILQRLNQSKASVIIVAFLQNATIEYSSESLCVCVSVCVCMCVCVLS